MIGLPAAIPIYLYTQPVDFRKGFDGLTGIVTTAMNHRVTEGALFLFVNRRRDRIKALWWETGGLTLWYRRLEQGTVELPKRQDDCSEQNPRAWEQNPRGTCQATRLADRCGEPDDELHL